MWQSSVESSYKDCFQENLPLDWFEFAKGCDYFELPSVYAKIIALAQVCALVFMGF